MSALPVTAVIINYHTPDLTERAVTSFRACYPDISLLLVDNDSNVENAHVLEKVQQTHPQHTQLITHSRNHHHGPAMDDALRRLSTPYVLFLDSDCTVLNSGFIEAMVTLLESQPMNYAAGKRIFMNKRGFDVEDNYSGVPYIRPVCMMVKRELYLTLPKFERHGAPCLNNMNAAAAQGYFLIDVSIEEYIHHEGRGTAGRFGYNLGWSGKLNHILNKLGL